MSSRIFPNIFDSEAIFVKTPNIQVYPLLHGTRSALRTAFSSLDMALETQPKPSVLSHIDPFRVSRETITHTAS